MRKVAEERHARSGDGHEEEQRPDAKAADQDPKTPKYSLKKANPWIMLFNLGAFMAGAAAGYFFSKAEEKFTSAGEEIVFRVLKMFRNGRGHERSGFGSRSYRFSDRDPDPDRGSRRDPMGDGGGHDFQEEDRL